MTMPGAGIVPGGGAAGGWWGGPFTMDPRYATAAANIGGVNRCAYGRVSESGLISKIALFIAVSSGNISVGVYRNTGRGALAAPGERVATSGAVASPGTGYQEIALTEPVFVNAGDWFALSADNTTATFNGTQLLAGHSKGFGAYQDVHPCPATASPTTGGRSFVALGIA